MPLTLHTVTWDRGIGWDGALAIRDEHLENVRAYLAFEQRSTTPPLHGRRHNIPHKYQQHREAVREAHAGQGPNPVPAHHRLEGKELDKFIEHELTEDDREGTGTGFYT